MKLLIIGLGHMGQALYKAWPFADTCDPNVKNATYNNINEIKKEYDFIVLSIRPNIYADIKNLLPKKGFLISVMAKIPIKDLPDNSCRLMPNLAVSIKKGMSALYNPKKMDQNELKELLEKTGKFIEVEKEEDIDKLTVISGSGPGFFYAFCDAFAKECKNLGFSKKISEEIIRQVFIGSASIMSDNTPSYMVNKVATKGGVTQAGVNILSKNLESVMKKTIQASLEKASSK